MKLRHLIFLASFAFASATAAAFGQSSSNKDLAPEQQAAPESPASPDASKSTFTPARDLEGLYAQLKRVRNRDHAKRIVARIWSLWQTSDSRSVDLLTHWAREATGRRAYAVALDLLDQVVTLRPDYAEGWNQRATVHYFMKNYGLSIADIERTLALEPRHFGALSGLANIMHIMGNDRKALQIWYRTLEVYPTMEQAQKAVIELEEKLSGRSL